jgi:uracil-DNA glycosylase
MIATLIWHLPRLEINSEGFTTIGAAGRRFRRWSEIEGDFTIGRFFMRPAVVWRLTEEARKTARIQKKSSPPDHDEAIMFSTELSLRPAELVNLLNQWKKDSAT